MANLYEKLPTEMQGPETIKAAPPAPSFLEALAGFGSKAIQSVNAGNDVHRQREAEARARAKAAREAGETAAENLAARGAVYAMFGSEEENMNAAIASAQAAAPGLLKQQEAEAQGRGPNPAMQRIRSEAVIRQLVAQNPGYEHVILSTLKEYGITSNAMKEYERAEKAIDDEISMQNEHEKKIESAMIDLGYDVNNLAPEDYVVARTETLRHLRSNQLFEEANRMMQYRTNEASLTRAQTEILEKKEGELRTRAFLDAMGPRLDVFLRSVTQLINNPALSDAERDKQIAELGRFASTEFPRQFNQMMGLYGVNMTSEQRTLVENNFNRGLKALNDLMTGPASLVEQNKRQIDLLKSVVDIDVMEAAPFWSYMKEMLGTETLGVLLSNEVLSDPQVRQRLSNEFKKAIELSPGEERLRMNNVIKILKREESLQSLGDPRKDAPVVLKVMKEMSKVDPITNGTDKQSHSEFMSAIENAASVAVEANVGWGFKNLLNIGSSFLHPGVVRGLATTTVNREDRTTAINAYQPALQNVYMALSNVQSGDKYYELVWDREKVRWGLRWNGKFDQTPSKGQSAFSGLAVGTSEEYYRDRVRPRPSKAASDQARILNNIIDVQSRLGSLGWDPSIPKDTPERERRLYYGRNILPEAVKKQNAEKTKTQGQNVEQLIQGFMQNLNSTPAYRTGDITESRADRNNNPGNIKDGEFAKSQPGYSGRDEQGYARFENPEAGTAAQVALLSGKGYYGGGKTTVKDIIEKWAPRESAGGDNTDEQVNNYINYVSDKLGVIATETLSAAVLPQLARAMYEFESGNKS